MSKLSKWFMISCKKSSELIEKEMYFGLNSFEKVQLSLHSNMCDFCKAYKKESKSLDKVLKDNAKGEPDAPEDVNVHLSDEAKKKIAEQLNKK